MAGAISGGQPNFANVLPQRKEAHTRKTHVKECIRVTGSLGAPVEFNWSATRTHPSGRLTLVVCLSTFRTTLSNRFAHITLNQFARPPWLRGQVGPHAHAW